MKRIAALGVVIAGFGTVPAFAADDCHVDLLLGGIYGQSQHIHSSTTPITDRFDLRGPAAGAGFGCTWSRSRWATGVTADLMHTTGKGHSQDQAPFNTNFTSHTELEWLGTLRLVVGYQSRPGNMIYFTGGAAAGPVKAKACPNGASGSACAAQSQTLYGLVGGFGAQWQFARHWSVKSEFLIFGFEKRPFLNPPPPGFADRAGGLEPEVQLARMALSYHF